MRSRSRGRVKLTSKHPYAALSIFFNYMSEPRDWEEFRSAVRLTREIMKQPALAEYCGEEIQPGVAVQSDEQIDAFVREHAETAYHPCGSCAMGYDDMAVVDAEGRVHGIAGRRVVDASIMPQITTGNLNAPTVMIAEKMADILRSRTPLPASGVDYYRLQRNLAAENL